MGYTIIYQRAFIRTTRGVIPMVLGGCNNVAAPYWDAMGRSRVRRERSWHPLYRNREILELPETELLAWIDRHPAEPEAELFRFYTDWIRGKQERAWFQAGIKAASTVEEYLLWNPTQSVRCELRINRAEPEQCCQRELTTYCKTTSELETWIDLAKARIREVEGKDPSAYVDFEIGFYGDKPMKAVPKISGPVAAKKDNLYLSGYRKDHWEFTRDASKAVIFPSVVAAVEALSPHFYTEVTLIKAASAEKAEKEKDWILFLEGGSHTEYVLKQSRSKLFYTYGEDHAKRFVSKGEALRCARRILEKFHIPGTLWLKNIRSGCTERVPAAK